MQLQASVLASSSQSAELSVRRETFFYDRSLTACIVIGNLRGDRVPDPIYARRSQGEENIADAALFSHNETLEHHRKANFIVEGAREHQLMGVRIRHVVENTGTNSMLKPLFVANGQIRNRIPISKFSTFAASPR